MNTVKTFVAALSIVSAGVALADNPAAIVEDIQAQSTGLSFMDYVNEGQVIKLGNEENITLGYMESCQREVITGGTVTVGKNQSTVSKGQLLREEVECNGGQAKLSGQQAGTSGALAFRSGSASSKPDVTIYGTAPVFRLNKANGEVTVAPVNRRGKSHTIEVKGHHVDLADKNISLSPGVYKAQAGDNSKVFKVHHRAEPGKAPIITRLVDL
jgi:hypothetical protein